MIEIPDKDYERLRESEERYKSLVKASPNAITVTDLQGKIAEVSKRTLELFRYQKESELLGRSAFEMIAPEDQQKAAEHLQKTLAQGHVENIEYNLIKKDGSRFIGELNASLIKGADGKPKAFIATVRDVTRRKLDEEDLFESERLYRTLAESSPDLIYIIDSEGKVHYTNSNAARQVGLTPEQAVGKRIDEFFPPQVVEKAKWDIQRVIEHGDVLTSEAMIPFGESQRWLEARMTPLRDHTGKTRLILGIARDMTERKKVEDQLRDKIKQINEFNKLAVGRELKIIEMEKELKRLQRELEE